MPRRKVNRRFLRKGGLLATLSPTGAAPARGAPPTSLAASGGGGRQRSVRAVLRPHTLLLALTFHLKLIQILRQDCAGEERAHFVKDLAGVIAARDVI